MIRWSAMLGALEALESRHHRDRRPPRVPERDRGSLVGDRRTRAPRSACGSCARTASPTATGADGARRGLAENDRFLRAGGRGLVGVHAAFTCSDETLDAAAGLAARLRRRRARPCGRGRRRRRGRQAPRPLATADDWLLAHCVHLDDGAGLAGHGRRTTRAPTSTTRVGYARPGRFTNPVVLGTDGIGADMLEEFRARLRPPPRARRRPRRPPPSGAGSRPAARSCPRPPATGSRGRTTPMDPWRLAYTPAVRARRRRRRRRGRARATAADPRRRGRGARRRPASRRGACSRAGCE